MTALAALTVGFVVLVFLVVIDRIQQHHTAQLMARDAREDRLLQRIQAPATAVAQFIPDDVPPTDPEEEESPVIHDEQDEIYQQVKGT